MNRNPPLDIRRRLRTEADFGCPIEGCRNPYLEYHHFDPPWAEREHHDPEGMIALCTMHHRQADGHAFTKDQLRALKQTTVPDATVQGRFNWLRNELVPVVGGNFWPGTLKIVRVGGVPIVWLRRDEAGYLRLNLRMLSRSGEHRLILEDNDWILKGNPVDFESPPSGRLISARYSNGDFLRVEFIELINKDAARSRYPRIRAGGLATLAYPLTAVEVNANVVGTPISFTPQGIRVNSPRMCGTIADNIITCTDFALDF